MRRQLVGFTLIELSTTVSIIAILAAILFPVFARARQKAYQNRCTTNLKQIALALSLYARDHAGHFPPTPDDLTRLVDRYLGDAEALTCPAAEARQETPQGKAMDYFYRAGFCDDDSPDTPLVADSDLDRHNGGANCLSLDGHVKWTRAPQYARPTAEDQPLGVFMRERGLGEPRMGTGGGIGPGL